MKGKVMLKACAIAAAWLLGHGIAHAGTVLYNEAGFIQGQQSFVQAFDITTPGTLTITLNNIPWLDTISNLSGFLSNSGGVMGNLFSDGGEAIQVRPGMVYAHWFGDADGAYGVGVYGIKVTFTPAGHSSVPLPRSIVLLMSGLVLLAAVSRSRRAAAAKPLIESVPGAPEKGHANG